MVSGEAYFEAAGDLGVTLGQGECKEHASLQDHALRTPDSPILSLVLWRGEGLAGDTVIS